MKRTLIPLITFLLSTVLAYAGGKVLAGEKVDFKSTTCRSDFGSYGVSDGSSAEAIKDFVQKRISNLGIKQASIQLTFSNHSPGGYHYTFCQTYMGIPVFSSDIVINVSRKNQVYSIFDDSYDMSGWKVDMTGFDYRHVPAYQSYLRQYFGDDVSAIAKQMIAYDQKANTPELCYLVNLKDKRGHQRDILMARDRILYEHDACMYRAAPLPTQDSLVTGMVFRPDPLTSAHVLYYAPYQGHDSAYQNFNDSDTYQLNVQREQKSFYASYDTGVFSLSNQYIQLQTLGSDIIAPVTSTTPSFNYTRSEDGFLDVQVFYHLNVIRSYVHSLGFAIADTLLIPDPHAFGQDNDYFSPPNNIYYGTGGVPDCQDADVIVHEYTHFLSWNANQSNGGSASTERNGVDEGSADYDATSYSASIDTFHWYWVFNWDGHNEYWPGRVVNDETVYPNTPTSPGLSTIYKYGEIWSSSLMQIYWDIGKGPADSLFFQTLYGLASNITLLDAAEQYIKADSLLFDGRYHCTIIRDFNQHGLATDRVCGTFPLSVENLANQLPFSFTAYPDGFLIAVSTPGTPVDVTLYDIAGQRLATYHNVTTEIKPDYLPAGIYVIDVSAAGQHQGYKWAPVK